MIFVALTKYYSGRQIKKNEMGGTCLTYDRKKRCIQNFGGEIEEKRPPGRHRRRLDNNIRMDLQEVGWRGMG